MFPDLVDSRLGGGGDHQGAAGWFDCAHQYLSAPESESFTASLTAGGESGCWSRSLASRLVFGTLEGDRQPRLDPTVVFFWQTMTNVVYTRITRPGSNAWPLTRRSASTSTTAPARTTATRTSTGR